MSATIPTPIRPTKKRPPSSVTLKPNVQRPSLQNWQHLQAIMDPNIQPVIQSSIQMQVTSHFKLPTPPSANTAGIWLDIDCPPTSLSSLNQSGMFPNRCDATVMRNEHQPSLLRVSNSTTSSNYGFDLRNDSQEISESIINETKI